MNTEIVFKKLKYIYNNSKTWIILTFLTIHISPEQSENMYFIFLIFVNN